MDKSEEASAPIRAHTEQTLEGSESVLESSLAPKGLLIPLNRLQSDQEPIVWDADPFQ